MGAACDACNGTGVREDDECPKCVGGDKDFVAPEPEPRTADEDTYETLEGYEKFVSEEEPEVDPTGSPTDESEESPEPSDSGSSEAPVTEDEAVEPEAGQDA